MERTQNQINNRTQNKQNNFKVNYGKGKNITELLKGFMT